jgi:serine/threonine protein kinase
MYTSTHVQVVAAISKETGRRVALKVVFLDNPCLKREHAEVLRAEVSIMKKLKHTNIVSFERIIDDPVRKQLVIAEEILLGGTLTDELLHGTNCNNDRLVAHIFKQACSLSTQCTVTSMSLL